MNSTISNLLATWYNQNKRDLPWRKTKNPYTIWISEIILQQTRVDQGHSYFNRFIEKFPDVKALADADEESVLKIWQGLGYYSRARNLHTAAKDIMIRFNGKFPTEYKDIISLKGIGEYTAAAISSISFKQPYAVVDGNVFRVISRLFAISDPIDTGKGKKLFTAIAQDILDNKNPGRHNQAIMELGALQCIPIKPDCSVCPLKSLCLAYATNCISKYPVKQGKVTVKSRYFNYFDIRQNGYTYMSKRTGNDIWKNLYELPLIETTEDASLEELLDSDRFKQLFGEYIKLVLIPMAQAKHILSHRIIHARFYRIELPEDTILDSTFLKVKADTILDYAVSRLVAKYFEDHCLNL